MQTREEIWSDTQLIETLQKGGVAVAPTDTIYGMLGRAQDEAAVERIYKIRKRSPDKPCIILIGDIRELEKFSVVLSEKQKEAVPDFWPGPVSIILECPDDSLFYLHRGTQTLAFRLPASPELREMLLKTGPLIAPSANQESFPPHDSAADAKKYFGDQVDLYMDGGVIQGKASKLIKLEKDGAAAVLRA